MLIVADPYGGVVMKEDATKTRLTEMLDALLAEEACELADIAVSRYKSNVTVRVFVYADGGVSLGLCTQLSRRIGAVIDGTDLFKGGYTLEVSSPGLDRPLTTDRDFRYRVGETVKIEFVDQDRKRLTADIIAAGKETVTLQAGEERMDIPLAEIKNARIVF